VWRDRVEHPDDYYYGCLLHDPETYCKDKELSLWRVARGLNKEEVASHYRQIERLTEEVNKLKNNNKEALKRYWSRYD